MTRGACATAMSPHPTTRPTAARKPTAAERCRCALRDILWIPPRLSRRRQCIQQVPEIGHRVDRENELDGILGAGLAENGLRERKEFPDQLRIAGRIEH